MANLNNKSLQPLVTVIIPSFNRPNMLKEALMSVLSQSYKNYEIIVINDGGDDGEDIIASLDTDHKIIYLQHEENRGLPAARNTGIRTARGKYIAYLDDDDIYYHNHLETLVKHLEDHDYQVAYTDSYYATQSFITDRYVTIGKSVNYSLDFDRNELLIHNYVPVINVMHTKDILEKAGLFDESLYTHEDWDLLIRFSNYSNFYHIKEITAEVRIREDGSNMMTGDKSHFLRTMRIIHARYANLVHDERIVKEQKQYEKNLEKQVEVQNIASTAIQYVNLHRYRFAKEFAKDKSVLDLRCGDGYGDFILAEDALEVTGLDNNDNQIRRASSRYMKENLKFIKGSITDLPMEAGQLFDIVIYFQGIEPIKEPDIILKRLKRLMKDDGILLLSMPNQSIQSDIEKGNKQIYTKGLNDDALKSIISKCFRNTLFCGQKIYPSSNIFPLFQGLTAIKDYAIVKNENGFIFLPKEEKKADYCIVIASDNPMKNLGVNSYLTDVSETLYKAQELHIERLNSEIQEKDDRIFEIHREYRAELERKEQEINEIRDSVSWQLLMRYRWQIERWLPQHTRRRRLYRLCIMAPIVLFREGPAAFFHKIALKLRLNRKANRDVTTKN